MTMMMMNSDDKACVLELMYNIIDPDDKSEIMALVSK